MTHAQQLLSMHMVTSCTEQLTTQNVRGDKEQTTIKWSNYYMIVLVAQKAYLRLLWVWIRTFGPRELGLWV